MAPGQSSSASSATFGSSWLLCECGVPAQLRAVSKKSQNEGRKFYGCGQFPVQNCGFFKWECDVGGGSGACSGCEELKIMLDVKEKELNSVNDKLSKVKGKKHNLEHKVEELRTKNLLLTVEKNKHLTVKMMAVVVVVLSWVALGIIMNVVV